MKVKDCGVRGASPVHLAFVTLTHRITFKTAIGVVWTILRYFFFPQFQTKLFPKTRPVVSVDHPLDASIPFQPEHVGLYLTFIPLWMKSCDHLWRLRGKEALPVMKEYLACISSLYREAASVYLTCQTTTARPAYRKGKFALIHLTDPHLHCVPSLHVLIVVFNHFWMARQYTAWGLHDEQARTDLTWIHEQAVSISESVLLVKQHSVNCIPAALLMLASCGLGISRDDLFAFADELFTILGTDLLERTAIRAHIHGVFTRLLAKMDSGASCRKIILGFIDEIKAASDTLSQEDVGVAAAVEEEEEVG